ncbi:unnamed protein product [Heterobilharzia americana]|nr:unnamed protein product [Heterobilharzia americana]
MTSFHGLSGVGIALSAKAESALYDWVPVDGCLRTVRLSGTVRNKRCSKALYCLSVIFAHAPTDCDSDEVRDCSRQKLSGLLLKAKRSKVVFAVSDFNTQVGSPGQS